MQLAPFFVKEFLIPLLGAFALPTEVNTFPWNSDIEVETDLEEKSKFMKGPFLGAFLSKNYLEQS